MAMPQKKSPRKRIPFQGKTIICNIPQSLHGRERTGPTIPVRKVLEKIAKVVGTNVRIVRNISRECRKAEKKRTE
jgi:hypothetical protein